MKAMNQVRNRLDINKRCLNAVCHRDDEVENFPNRIFRILLFTFHIVHAATRMAVTVSESEKELNKQIKQIRNL